MFFLCNIRCIYLISWIDIQDCLFGFLYLSTHLYYFMFYKVLSLCFISNNIKNVYFCLIYNKEKCRFSLSIALLLYDHYLYKKENLLIYNALSSSFVAISPMKCFLYLCSSQILSLKLLELLLF